MLDGKLQSSRSGRKWEFESSVSDAVCWEGTVNIVLPELLLRDSALVALAR